MPQIVINITDKEAEILLHKNEGLETLDDIRAWVATVLRAKINRQLDETFEDQTGMIARKKTTQEKLASLAGTKLSPASEKRGT